MSEFNYDVRAVERFVETIKIRTISSKEGNSGNEEFAKFLPTLKELYPKVFALCETKLINEFGILLHFKGQDSSLSPVVLMAHHDVVSDEGQDWKYPAFEGEIHDSCVWGRGSIDTKVLIVSFLEAMERLIEKGITPKRDIYFASSDCEEIGGDTMPKIVEYFKENGIKPAFVLDEGGAIMSSLPMGIKTPFAMVAVSEKGWANLKLTASGKTAKHSAKQTKSVTAPDKLVAALSKLKATPMKAVITPCLEGMLSRFSPYIPAPLNVVLGNIKYFRAPVKKVMASNADTAAMISSQISLTSIEAPLENGLTPETASATLKVRIAPHDTLDGVIAHIKEVVGEDIEIEVQNASLPAPISDHNTKSFSYIEKTIKKVFPDVGVAPFILNAGTDSRHFASICKEIYRFGAFRLDDELFATVHSANERMPIKDFMKCIEFYEEFVGGME